MDMKVQCHTSQDSQETYALLNSHIYPKSTFYFSLCHVGSDADFAVCTAIVSKVKTTNDLRIYQHVSEYLVKFKKKKVREGHV